jgi:hypothetical protein
MGHQLTTCTKLALKSPVQVSALRLINDTPFEASCNQKLLQSFISVQYTAPAQPRGITELNVYNGAKYKCETTQPIL